MAELSGNCEHKRRLEGSRFFLHNMYMINERELQDEYTRQINELLDKPNGLDMWCWLRRRASKLLECELGDYEEIGSSDVSCKLYDCWKEWHLLHPDNARYINESLGFHINSEVQKYIY